MVQGVGDWGERCRGVYSLVGGQDVQGGVTQVRCWQGVVGTVQTGVAN